MKRIVIKLSGETLKNKEKDYNIDEEKVKEIAHKLKRIHDQNVELIIVVGAGNLWRGRNSAEKNNVTSDEMGMLCTIVNSLALKNGLSNLGVKTKVFSSFQVEGIVPKADFDLVEEHLSKKEVVIMAGGVGIPYCTTDVAAIYHASRLKADTIIFSKSPAGVYDKDPKEYKDAKKIDLITSLELLKNHLTNGLDKKAVIDFIAESFAINTYKGTMLVIDLNDEKTLNFIIKNIDKPSNKLPVYEVGGTIITNE